MIFDTHAHYDDKAFDEDRDELLRELNNTSVDLILNPGCDVRSSELARDLSHRYDFLYFAAGIHPEELEGFSEDWLRKIRELAGDKKCAAIGEIGLDYYWDKSRKDLQKQVFDRQLTMAEELELPVIVHDREAHEDSMNLVFGHPGIRGVFHCYSGSAEMARELLKKGWYLGFDGPVTYKNARKTIEVLEICPLDRILIETDSPYMSPVPLRGRRNHSGNLHYVAEKIAEIREISKEEVLRITRENGLRLFSRIRRADGPKDSVQTAE